jgi:hypothetical protein
LNLATPHDVSVDDDVDAAQTYGIEEVLVQAFEENIYPEKDFSIDFVGSIHFHL